MSSVNVGFKPSTRLFRALTVVALVTGFLSAAPATTAGEVRTGDNYRLGGDFNPLRGKQAPGLAVNPANPDHIVEVQVDLLNSECQYNTSTDGGVTWAGGNLKAPFPLAQSGACSLVGHGATGMDGSVAFGTGNNVYVAWGSALPNFGNTALVSRSTDGGLTFEVATPVLQGGPSPAPGPNHAFPKLAVVAGGGSDGADRIVLAAANTLFDPTHGASGSVIVTSSDDGGATWSDPVAANAPLTSGIEHTQVVVGEDGAMYVGWRTSVKEGFIQIGKSTDGGGTWTQVSATPVRGHANFCCSSFPRLAIDPGDALADDVLYLVWSQDPGLYEPPQFRAEDHFMNQDSDVWFMRSVDAGATWTDRRQINDFPFPGELTQTRHPNVSVAPDGRVDVVWHDRRHWYRGCSHTHAACQETRLGDTYLVTSADQGRSFSPNRRVTDRSLNNDVGFDYRFGTYWDYGPVSASLGGGRVMVAWMDSREGNFDNDTQDIYLAKVDLNAAGPVPVKAVGQGGPSSLSVALSRAAHPGGGEAVLSGTFATRPATSLVVARSETAGALAGAVLARANVGSLLLTPKHGLPDDVKAEVARMAPVGAYVLGDTAELSPQVVTDLENAGVPADKIVRLSGDGASGLARKAALAAAVATTLDRRSNTQRIAQVPAFDAVVITNPDSPDAAAASTLAANRRLPFLYVDKDSIPTATRNALASLNVNRALVVGGQGWVGSAVESELAVMGNNPKRLGGADQYATSRAVVAESIARGLPTNQVFTANGNQPLHGALLGAASGRIGGVLLLVPGGDAVAAEGALPALGLSGKVDRLVTSRMTN